MPRCNACNGIITRKDVDCYVCGEPIPGRSKFSFFRLFAKRTDAAASKRALLRVTTMDSSSQKPTSL